MIINTINTVILHRINISKANSVLLLFKRNEENNLNIYK